MVAPLTKEQKTRIVEWFLQTNSIVTVQRRFKNQYKCKEAPARNTLKTLVEQFRANGNVAGKKRGWSKPRVRTPDTVETIHASVASSPTRKSVGQLAAENEVLPSTAWSILRTNLRMHPYKIHVFQFLTTVCREKRTSFAEEFGDHLQQNPHTLEHIWFSDEAYFHFTGDINRQNVRFWVAQHSHQIHESTLHAQKALAWRAVFAQALNGPFIFEDYVTGKNYAMMLDSLLLPQMRRRQGCLHGQWFKQDGARPHTTPEVLEFLHSKFQHTIMSSHFPQQFQCGFSWPPCSPDLNPYDYFLWGYLKGKVFGSAPRSLPKLKKRIKESCAQVTRGMLTRVVQNFVLLLQAVRDFQEVHIEHVIHNATHM
jgi:hypothetical protein